MNLQQSKSFLQSEGRVEAIPIVVKLDESELRDLVAELEPARDTEWQQAPDAAPARVALSETHWRLRGGFTLQQTSPHYEQRCALRPAVAAANQYNVDIPWHRSALTKQSDALRDIYADRLFASIGAQNDSNAFLQMMTGDAEVLVPLLDRAARVQHVRHLVDERALRLADTVPA